MKPPRTFEGMLNIARFNWPLYAGALFVFVASFAGVFLLTGALKLISAIILLGASYFGFGSLGVSHFIYDRSDLYRWSWLDRALKGAEMHTAIFCHSGFDETSKALREKFPGTLWNILDHYNPEKMTEPSIHRARALFPPTQGTLPGRYNAWPLDAASADVIFALLAVHEFRTEVERTAWFAEARRCLRTAGRVVLVEHLRDTANFLAFGPGFMHFYSSASWRRCWEGAGLRVLDQFRVTPFVKIFVLTPE